MPQASERWLATPMIRPRLPRMRPEDSGILVTPLDDFRPQASYGIGPWGPASARRLIGAHRGVRNTKLMAVLFD